MTRIANHSSGTQHARALSRPVHRAHGARLAAALGAPLLLAACSILPEQIPVDTYVLPGAQRAQGAAHNASATGPALRITCPAAQGVLAGKRIAVMPRPDRIEVYQGAHWNDPPAHMLRSRLLDAFMADGRLPRVDTDEGHHSQADYLLATQLRAFHGAYENGQPTAAIRMDAQIIHMQSNRMVANRSFVVRQPAAGKEVSAVVQAFGQAADQLGREVVDWAVQHTHGTPAATR